jgi:hypothetical protein
VDFFPLFWGQEKKGGGGRLEFVSLFFFFYCYCYYYYYYFVVVVVGGGGNNKRVGGWFLSGRCDVEGGEGNKNKRGWGGCMYGRKGGKKEGTCANGDYVYIYIHLPGSVGSISLNVIAKTGKIASSFVLFPPPPPPVFFPSFYSTRRGIM